MSIHRQLLAAAWFTLGTAACPILAHNGDFDGDGHDDLPVVVAREAAGAIDQAGGLNLIYGTGHGLSAAGDQFFTRATPGFAGDPAEQAMLAGAVASGDFDDDGFDDLAIGFGSDTVDGAGNAGSVNVLYGSASGVRLQGDQRLHRNVPGVIGNAVASDFFGSALTVGDFDDDGFDDLAVGVFGDSLGGGSPFAGSVHIFYGSNSGLSGQGDQVFSQQTAGMAGTAMPNERFGIALAAGDFDDDGRDDLAIGVYLDYVAGVQAGSVAVLYGTSSGLSASGDDLLHQNVAGVANSGAAGDRFGFALAAGNFDGDGFDDLAVGVPTETVGGVAEAGAVAVFYGSPSGLSVNGDQLWHQDKSSVKDSAEPDDRFGNELAAGDFDDDGFDDLAIGIPFEPIEAPLVGAGAVAILYGSSQGLQAGNDAFLHQNVPGVAGTAAASEVFGAALHVGDFDGDGRDDLAVAAPLEAADAVLQAGTVTVFYGSGNGLSTSGEQVFSQATDGIKSEPAIADWFGLTSYYRLLL